MADIRINALATTAASTASDDFIAIDGSANGTRKLNAYSPTFGGNLTVSGTVSSGVVTSSFADALSSFTRTGLNGAGAAGVLAIATDGKTINDAISFAIQGKDSANNAQTYGQIKATIVDPTSTSEDSTFTIQTVTAGSLADAAVFSQSAATLAGNLTVSGTGTSSFAGNVTVTGTGAAYTAIDTGSFVKIGNDQTGANLQLGSKSGAGAILQGAATGIGAYALVAQPYGGNFLIGTTTDGGQKLQVNGSAALAGDLLISTNSVINFTVHDAYLRSAGGKSIYFQPAGTTALTLDASQNATFAGTGTFSGASLTLSNSTDPRLRVVATGATTAGLFLSPNNNGGGWTVAAAASATPDLIVYDPTAGGTEKFRIYYSSGNIENTGSIKTAAPSGGTAATWRLGNVASVSPTSPNRTIEVQIGATTYYIHAKTTND